MGSICRRIADYRKLCGFRNTLELANHIGNPKITHTVISNIESGRRNDPSISEVVEIARGLGVSPLLLLVPVFNPKEKVDLPNVGAELSEASSEEFLRWLTFEQSILFRREQTQLDLYQALKSVQRLSRLQDAIHSQQKKLNNLPHEVKSRRLLLEQETTLYQDYLHSWYELRMSLRNVPGIDLSWTDESLVEELDIDYRPTDIPLASGGTGWPNRGLS